MKKLCLDFSYLCTKIKFNSNMWDVRECEPATQMDKHRKLKASMELS